MHRPSAWVVVVMLSLLSVVRAAEDALPPVEYTREVLDNGTWGELVPVNDAAAMSSAIVRALDAPARRPPAAWFGRYDLAAVTDTYLSLLGVSPAGERNAPP